MDTLDIMIEEAEKKTVKKYRPNMFAEFKQLNDTNGKVSIPSWASTSALHELNNVCITGLGRPRDTH